MADEFLDIPEDPKDGFLALVLRYFDGDLNGAETAELNDLLRHDAESRRRFAEYCTRVWLIRETFDSEQQAPRRQERSAPRTPPESTRPVPAAAKRRWPVGRLTAGVAAAVAAGLLLLWWSLGDRDEAATIGRLESISGDVQVITSDGHARAVEPGAPIRSGDTVRTTGVQSAAAVVYPDGTRLTLVGDTVVTCADRGRKNVVVHQGTVAASVAPQQEGKPMVLETPAAAVEVLGTDFYCLAQTDQTDVSVTRGRVRVTRASDGRVVEVTEGKRVLATKRAELAVEDIPRPPDTWDLDFEAGLPKDFKRGLPERNRLPRGSGGAVRAVSRDMGEEGTFYEIATPHMWCHGLFRVHDDSHFHFTFKMDKPGWLNVFVIARGLGPGGPYSINYLFDELRFWGRPPGTWQTVGIPLTQFKRMLPREGKAFEGEVPYLVLFSSLGDRGLVIDRVWVTRGGPGVVRYEDVE